MARDDRPPPELILFLGLFLAGFGLLAWGAMPAVGPQDSAEFSAAVCGLGIPHAPGFPAYILSGRALAEAVPFGNPAYRLNLLSAVCAAGAAALIGWLVCVLSRGFLSRTPYVLPGHDSGLVGRRGEPSCSSWAGLRHGGQVPAGPYIGGILAAGLWLTAGPVWNLGIVAEAFGPHALLVAAFLAWALAGTSRALPAAGLAWGVGIAAHQVSVLLGPAAAAWAWVRRGSLSRRLLAGAGGAVVLGGALYLSLAIRSMAQPALDWGDPETPHRLWRVITRADYGTLRLASAADTRSGWLERVPAQASRYGRAVAGGLGTAGLGLAAAGAWFLWRRGRRDAVLLGGLVWISHGPLLTALGNMPADRIYDSVLERLYLPDLLVLSLWAGVGAAELLSRTGAPDRPEWRATHLAGIAALLTLVSFRVHGAVSQGTREDLGPWDLGRNTFRTLPKGAVAFQDGDTFLYVPWALQGGWGLRPDLRVVGVPVPRWYAARLSRDWPDLAPALARFPEGSAAVMSAAASVAGLSVFVNTNIGPARGVRDRLGCAGLAYAFGDRAGTCRAARTTLRYRYVYRGLSSRRRHEAGTFAKQIMDAYAQAAASVGYDLLMTRQYPDARAALENAVGWNGASWEARKNLGAACYYLRDYPAALDASLRAERMNGTDPEIPNNVGIVLYAQGRRPEAAAAFRRALDRNPGFLAARQNLRLVPGL